MILWMKQVDPLFSAGMSVLSKVEVAWEGKNTTYCLSSLKGSKLNYFVIGSLFHSIQIAFSSIIVVK